MEWKLKDIKVYGDGLNKIAIWVKGENEIVVNRHEFFQQLWIWTVNGKHFDQLRPKTEKMSSLLDEVLVTALAKRMEANKLSAD